MDHQLKLTARGHAVCELMADHGLSLDAACARFEQELETLRAHVARISRESRVADLTRALEAALAEVSVRVQHAYLEELELARTEAALPNLAQRGEATLH